jgi:hypothetical protein
MIGEKKSRIKNNKKEDKTEKPPISERLLELLSHFPEHVTYIIASCKTR